jgi:hypothetical protein
VVAMLIQLFGLLDAGNLLGAGKRAYFTDARAVEEARP